MTRCDVSHEYDDCINETLQTLQAAMLQLIEMKGDGGHEIKLL
jgi:hypothetical protein